MTRTLLSLTIASLLFAGESAWAAAAQDAGPRDLSGVWWVTRYSPKLEIDGGGELPYNEAGRARHARNMAGLRDGSVNDMARRVCTPDGIPRILGNPYPFQIVHVPGQTYFLYELNHVIRNVGMNQPQKSADDLEIFPQFSGHSVAYWEGDMLVVETGGFTESTFLDATGAPHSATMKTVERLRKINAGRQLENVVTITDPTYLTRPVTARFVYDFRPDVRLESYTCGEVHRDINGVPGVAEARRARGL
jgi:hypothetical protein